MNFKMYRLLGKILSLKVIENEPIGEMEDIEL